MTEEVLFHAVLSRPEAERAGYLVEHCSDPELRRRIEGLLAAHVAAGGPLDRHASTGDFTPEPAETPGTMIGPYKLLQQLGEGGMGAVYMAEQEHPVKRRVAVKIIKAGMDSAQVIARFEAERQALALMDHPNIARVLDAGTTEQGRPYFVMELVKGIPITRFCDQQHLTPRERLELFVHVCQAVQHAHQKGVIHRDLKPSNVLVALYDDRPVPKVIDFGVAKATGERLTDRTMFTEFGAIVGTLEYMSPEQARLNALDIDTRTDVYALGVILYELLTGTTPLDRKRLRTAALDELLRIIRDEEPPKPSTRLSGSAELPSIAANRRTEPKKLGKLVRGELDWVVMKALEKDRARRYETANGLARDLQRYLADEPVEACPPSAGYRLRKFARKHRAAFATATSFALLLTTAALVSTSLAVWAIRSERVAEIREQQATADRDTADKERRRAEASDANAQHNLYIANMNRVRFELDNNNVTAARKLLNLYRDSPIDRDPRGWEWYYWDRATQGELYTLQAHSGSITDLVFSPDGALFASAVGGANPALKLWDTVTGAEVRAIQLAGPVSDVAFRPDGQVLAGRVGVGVIFWDVATGQAARNLRPEGNSTCGPLAFSPDGQTLAVSVTEGGRESLRFWDLRSGQWRDTLPLAARTTRLCYSADGKLLAQMHGDGVTLWDIPQRAPRNTFTSHSNTSYAASGQGTSGVTGLAFSPDGRRLATCGRDGTAVLHDIASSRDVRTLAGPPLSDVAFTADGDSLMTAGDNGFLACWLVQMPRLETSARLGQKLRTYYGHSGRIQRMSLSADGTRLVTGGSTGEIKLWDATASPTHSRALTRANRAAPLTFSPDGTMLAHFHWWGAEVRALATDRPRSLLVRPGSTADGRLGTALAFSPDSRLLATTYTSRRCQLWELGSRPEARSFSGLVGQRHTVVAFSPDGQTLAFRTGTSDTQPWQIRLLDVATGKEEQSFPGEGVAFSPDGQTLALAGSDRVLRLIDRPTRRELRQFKDRHVSSFVTFSRDGRRLYYGGAVWDVAGDRVCRLGKDDPVEYSSPDNRALDEWSAYFSPDGRRLFSATPKTLRVWDAETGDLLLDVAVPGVNGLAVHPDGWQCAISAFAETWLVVARPLTPELRQQREVHNLVAYLFNTQMLKAKVLAQLRALKTISESVRRDALALAQQQEDDPDLLNSASAWILLRIADPTPAEYGQSLKWAEAAVKLAPEWGHLVNSYGILLYRVGRYEDAVAALERSCELNASPGNDQVIYDLLFLAMAQWKSGRHEEAQATLQRARDRRVRYAPTRFWREADELIEGKAIWPNDALPDVTLRRRELVLRLLKDKRGSDHRDTLTAMDNLAEAYQSVGRPGDALRLHEELLRIERLKSGPDHLLTAIAMAQLAYTQLLLQKYGEAESLLRECRPIFEKSPDSDYRRFNVQSLLGEALAGQRRYDEATPLLLEGYKGLKARENPAGAKRVMEAVERLVRLYDAIGQPEKAREWRDEQRR